MGEIKFRLRDRHNNIVGYEKWFTGSWHPDDLGFAPTDGYWEASPCWLYSTDGEKWTPTLIPHRYKDQYIGLKDKNGKEIYEGDIVKGEYYTEPWIVEWDEEGGLEDGSMNPEEWIIGFRFPNEMKLWVIGNIYENPELLESK